MGLTIGRQGHEAVSLPQHGALCRYWLISPDYSNPSALPQSSVVILVGADRGKRSPTPCLVGLLTTSRTLAGHGLASLLLPHEGESARAKQLITNREKNLSTDLCCVLPGWIHSWIIENGFIFLDDPLLPQPQSSWLKPNTSFFFFWSVILLRRQMEW